MVPRLGMVLSAGLHVIVIVMAVLGLPHWWDDNRLAEAAVHVEIITIAEESAAPPPEPVVEPEEPEPVLPQPEPVAAAVEDAPPEPLPEPEPTAWFTPSIQ